MNDTPLRGTTDRIVLTAADQRDVDAAAVAAGTSSAELMESAGTASADWILDRLDPKRVALLIGPGGNGGDGLVVARRLADAGVDVLTLLVPEPGDLKGASRTMLERLPATAKPTPIAEACLEDELASCDWVVDALFGTGLTRPLEGVYGDVVERANASRARIVSLDLPSGSPSDDGEILGPTIRAHVTLAMTFLKPAHLRLPAASHCGNVAVVPVAYPSAAMQSVRPRALVPELAGIARRLPARPPDGHKGTFGRVLVLAGSEAMTGAAILTCRAALRAGAGLVFLAAPAGVRDILEGALPEVITLPMPEEEGGLAGLENPGFVELLAQADVLAIGPGLGRHDSTLEAVRDAVLRFGGPIVLDADGVHAFVDGADALRAAGARLLLTPHPGEFAALAGLAVEEVDTERARSFAQRIGAAVLLKGRPTAIASPGGELWLNPTGNTGLATGGSGDVLTGMIAGFVAGGATLTDAAIAGAYLHGRAAEIFAKDRAERSLTPSDVLELLPYVLREAERETESWR